MLEKHPIAVWASVVVTLVTMAAGVAGGWYMILDERERSIAQSATLEAVRAEQVAIRKELALQTSDLEEIRHVQGNIIGTVDRRLDKIEDGHDRIIAEISRTTTALAVEVGRVSGRQERQ